MLNEKNKEIQFGYKGLYSTPLKLINFNFITYNILFKF